MLSAYDIISPTSPASMLPPATLATANMAAQKMIADPWAGVSRATQVRTYDELETDGQPAIAGNRGVVGPRLSAIAGHRGKRTCWFRSSLASFSAMKRGPWLKARTVLTPASNSENEAKMGDLVVASSRFSSLEVLR